VNKYFYIVIEVILCTLATITLFAVMSCSAYGNQYLVKSTGTNTSPVPETYSFVNVPPGANLGNFGHNDLPALYYNGSVGSKAVFQRKGSLTMITGVDGIFLIVSDERQYKMTLQRFTENLDGSANFTLLLTRGD
jgi:hypothetical protein